MASIIYKGGVSTGGGGSITWQEKTADFTAQSGYGYFVDSTSPVIVTLPASASIGDTFYVVNISGSVVFDGLIQGSVSPNGFFYKGNIITEQILSFYYLDAIYGWFCDKSLLSFATTDPYTSSVVIYLKGDDANGSTNIVDVSPTPKTISVFGDSQISTAQSKYGGSSLYFDGTGDYLTTSDFADFGLGTGDFTLELWLYLTVTWSDNVGLFSANGGTGGTEWGVGANASQLRLWLGTNTTYNFGFNPPSNTWCHIALTREGSDLRAFKDGVLTSSSTVSFDLGVSKAMSIGKSTVSIYTKSCTGYIDSFRITKGVARYTATFDPETDTYLAY